MFQKYLVDLVILSLAITFSTKACAVNLEQVKVKDKEIAIIGNKGNTIDIFKLGEAEEIKNYCFDKENSEVNYLFLVVGRKTKIRGERVVILSLKSNKLKKIWEGLNSGYNPWKILVSDVDGDGKLDVCIGVWKKARFHPVFDNRLFIFGWEEEEIFPKWLGSRLSSPMLDFDFADIDQDGLKELISLEIQKNNLRRIMAYKWKGFGFEGIKILAQDLKQNTLDDVKSYYTRSER